MYLHDTIKLYHPWREIIPRADDSKLVPPDPPPGPCLFSHHPSRRSPHTGSPLSSPPLLTLIDREAPPQLRLPLPLSLPFLPPLSLLRPRQALPPGLSMVPWEACEASRAYPGAIRSSVVILVGGGVVVWRVDRACAAPRDTPAVCETRRDIWQ